MSSALSNLRVGFGFDIHRFEPGAPLVLGGVRIDHDLGLVSHTDGDAVCHAVMDALFTACGLPDIGAHFPPGDERLRGLRSLDLLGESVSELQDHHIEAILNVTVTVLAEHPRLGPQRERIAGSLAAALGLDTAQVAVAFGTNERFDAVGRGEALAVFANVLLVRKADAGERSRTSQSMAAPVSPLTQIKTRLSPTMGGSASADATADPESALPEEALPPRVRQFERAVKTRLPPLPRAAAPAPGSALILYTDGASRGNPGPAASGWVLFNDTGFVVHEQGTPLGQLTNNEAEYAALAEALGWVAANLGTDYALTVRMDSELVVKQLKGEYKIKAEHLRQTALLIMAQLADFTDLTLQHVPRAENSRADALANAALDAAKR